MICNGAEIDKSLHFIASVIENDKQALESPWKVSKCSKHQYVGAMTNVDGFVLINAPQCIFMHPWSMPLNISCEYESTKWRQIINSLLR